METKRNSNKQWIYLAAALLAGLLAGYLIFSGPGQPSADPGVSKGADHNHAVAPENQMWTCSMHPQIMQPEPGDCPICGMDLIPAGTGSGELGAGQIRMTENAMALADIRTTRIGEHPDGTSGSITLSGEIVEDQEAKTVQASYFDGRIESLNIHFEGQQIQKGQQLATLYAPGLVAAQQELLTAASLKESQAGLYQAVRKKLKYWKLTDQQIDQIESSGTVQEYFPVYATVSGTVIEMMVSEGDYVKKGQPLARLSNLERVWVDFDAYENQLDLFELGQEITITTNAYAGTEFRALITFIDPVLDTRTRTVTVRAGLANTEGLLKPGMFVTGLIAVEGTTSNTALTVPASAVMWTGERSLVYVKTRAEDPVFEMREVTLGNRVGDSFVIESGLEAGAEIVTHGTFTVDAAAQLQGKRSMMNPRTSTSQNTMKHQYPEKLSKAFQIRLLEAIPSYLMMKDAFVESKPGAVSTNAREFREALETSGRSGPDDDGGAYLSEILERLDAIELSGDLEEQRRHFVILNEHLIALAQKLDLSDSPLYVQHCPMANQNKGALWLSDNKEIRNPYYGDAMLTCGSVMDSIQ